jgi:hypothetical protein
MNMKIRIILAVAVAVASLQSLAARAQATTNLFRVSFKASCSALNGAGKVTTTSLTDEDIIANATGVTRSSKSHSHSEPGFALAYNTAADSLQVVDANGNLVADVINFGGGVSVSDSRQRDRFTFMFVPSLTDAIGSAVISENVGHSEVRAGQPRANIVGKLQFALAGSTVLGSTNSGTAFAPPSGGTNSGNFFMTSAYDDPTAQICLGTFFTKDQIQITGISTNPPVTSTNSP